MSNTVRKNGKLIEVSLARLCKESEFTYSGQVYVSVGQVANDAGVSKPTARKYLNMLWEAGCAEWLTWNGAAMYAHKDYCEQ